MTKINNMRFTIIAFAVTPSTTLTLVNGFVFERGNVQSFAIGNDFGRVLRLASGKKRLLNRRCCCAMAAASSDIIPMSAYSKDNFLNTHGYHRSVDNRFDVKKRTDGY